MPVKYEDHEGIQIPVGDKFPTGESAIMPSKGGWAGSVKESNMANGEGGSKGNAGGKSRRMK
jgi:hypothetical protein